MYVEPENRVTAAVWPECFMSTPVQKSTLPLAPGAASNVMD
jgi:hypothetical protein